MQSVLSRQSDRWWSLVLMSLTIPAGIAPFLEPDAFVTPIFDTVKDIASIQTWGFVWLLAAFAAGVSAVKGSWVAYVVANSLTLGLCTAWLGAVAWAKFVNDQTLTITAIGLWLFPMCACVHAIMRPTEVHYPREA